MHFVVDGRVVCLMRKWYEHQNDWLEIKPNRIKSSQITKWLMWELGRGDSGRIEDILSIFLLFLVKYCFWRICYLFVTAAKTLFRYLHARLLAGLLWTSLKGILGGWTEIAWLELLSWLHRYLFKMCSFPSIFLLCHMNRNRPFNLTTQMHQITLSFPNWENTCIPSKKSTFRFQFQIRSKTTQQTSFNMGQGNIFKSI